MVRRKLLQRLRRARYDLVARYGSRRPASGLPPATVILLSYRRPQNMAAIVGALLRLRFVERIVLSNNHPDVRMRDWVRQRDPRLQIVDQGRHRPCAVRAELARDADAERFISIDDDLFLTARQVETVYRRFLEEPEIVHGVEGGLRTHQPDRRFRAGIRGDTPVDIVFRAYFFSRRHVEGWFRNLRAIGVESPDALRNGEDILLSFAGEGRPRCHDVGPLLDCETSTAKGVALCREEGFVDRRVEIYDRLAALRQDRSA